MADGGSYLDFENIKNQAKTDDVGTPDPKKSMIFFMMLSLIYGIFVSTTILSSTSIEQVEENSTNFIFILIYILLLIIGMYFLNLNIAKSICQNDTAQYSNVFFATILPWIIVFGILYFILEIFTGWVRPFSNTIGYVVVSLLGAEELIKNLLNTKEDNSPSITQALIQIEQNKSKFINEFEPDKSQFKEFIERLRAEGLTKNTSLTENKISKDEIELFKLVNIKHIIGKLMWYILAGTVISSISYNYIINIKCTQTLKDVEKLIESQNK
jgi:hypothetical protein